MTRSARGRRLLAAASLAPGLLAAAALAYLPAWLGPWRVAESLASGYVAHALALSLATAAVVTVLALATAAPAAYLLSRRLVPATGLLEALASLPLGMPPVALGALLLLLLAGPLKPLDQALGLLFTPKALVLAQYAVVYPLAVRSLRAAFDQVPAIYEVVARSLGARPHRVFLDIVLPMARRGVAAAAVLTYLRALGEFGASVTVAGVKPDTATIPIAIYERIGGGDLAGGLALVLVSAAAAAAGTAALRVLEERSGA